MLRKIYYLYLREMDQKPSLTSLNKQLCPYKPLAWWRCGGGSVTVQRRRQLGGGAVAVAAAVAAARQCNGGGGMRNGDATATEGRSSSTISRSRRRRSRASMTRVHFLSLRWVAGNGRGGDDRWKGICRRQVHRRQDIGQGVHLLLIPRCQQCRPWGEMASWHQLLSLVLCGRLNDCKCNLF